MGDDGLGAGRLEDAVAAGVIAVEVRVDHQVDAAAAGLRLQPVDADLRGLRELRVDDDDGILG